MGRALPFVLAIAVTIYALVDCAQTEPTAVRGLRKPAWIVVIVALNAAGALAWLVAGRPRRRPGRPTPAPRQPLAPDDDPEFLRRLREGHAPPSDDGDGDSGNGNRATR